MFWRVELWRTGRARLEDQVGAVMKRRPEVATHAEAPHNLGEKLEELQTLLLQMEEIAGEGRQLLAWLAPQVDQSSTWIAELESMLYRWKSAGGGGAGRRRILCDTHSRPPPLL